MTVTIYMPLAEEGTDVWRPVEAELLADGRYRVIGEEPADETWKRPRGSIASCAGVAFGDGAERLVVVG